MKWDNKTISSVQAGQNVSISAQNTLLERKKKQKLNMEFIEHVLSHVVLTWRQREIPHLAFKSFINVKMTPSRQSSTFPASPLAGLLIWQFACPSTLGRFSAKTGRHWKSPTTPLLTSDSRKSEDENKQDGAVRGAQIGSPIGWRQREQQLIGPDEISPALETLPPSLSHT